MELRVRVQQNLCLDFWASNRIFLVRGRFFTGGYILVVEAQPGET